MSTSRAAAGFSTLCAMKDNKSRTSRKRIPLKLLLLAAGMMFAFELAIMFAIDALPPLSHSLEAALDSLVLSAIALPILYILFSRPLLRSIKKYEIAEKELNRFKTTLDMTLDCVFMFDPVTLKFFYVNQGAMDQVGYSAEELYEMTPVDIKPLYTEQSFRKMINLFLGGEMSTYTFETVHRQKGGKDIPVEVFLQYIAPPGEESRFVAIVRDITEHKQTEEELRRAHGEMEERVKMATAEIMAANEYLRLEIADRKRIEEELRESEEKYRALIERASDGIVIIQDSLVRYINPRAAEMIGYTAEESLGTEFLQYMHPEERPKVMERYKRRLAGESIPRIYETRIISKSGDIMDIEVNAGVIHYEGAPADMIFLRDITERKRAEKELREAHTETEQLIAAIPSILIKVDDNQRIVRWNEAAEKTFGIKAKDVIGKKFTESGIKWNTDEISKHITSCYSKGGACRADDIPYTREDGKNGFLAFTFTPIYTNSENYGAFLALGADVTERKILESQLTQAQKLESIGQLAAGIAHEINTPTQYVGDNIRFFKDVYADFRKLLTAYDGLIEAAKNGSALEDAVKKVEDVSGEIDIEYLLEEIPKAIDQSLGGVERVAKIVRAMKEFSHPGVDEKTAIDINKAIESTITVARNEWKYVADMETDFDPALPLVPVLPGEFNQVILNLIVNSAHAIADVVKDSQEKGMIKVSTKRYGDFAEVRVADTGKGIPKEIAHRIFDPFFTTKEVGKGTGQGLAIARSAIVDKHGGTITFETEPGKGTAFIIRLPLAAEIQISEEDF